MDRRTIGRLVNYERNKRKISAQELTQGINTECIRANSTGLFDASSSVFRTHFGINGEAEIRRTGRVEQSQLSAGVSTS